MSVGCVIVYLGENCVESDLGIIYLGSKQTVGKLYDFDGHIL